MLVLDQGRCIAYGSYRQIQESGLDFVSLLQNDSKDSNEENHRKTRTESEVSAKSATEMVRTLQTKDLACGQRNVYVNLVNSLSLASPLYENVF